MILFLVSHAASLVSTVFAAAMPPVNCPPSLPSCGSANTSMLINILLIVVEFVVDLAVALALLFVLWAGLEMVIAFGDEGKTSKARTRIVYALAGVFVALSSQSIYSIFVQNYGTNTSASDLIFGGTGGGGILPTLANGIVVVFNPIFVLSIIIAGIRMVLARGKEDEFGTARKMLFWSIAGAVVINLAYAIVKVAVDLASPA